MSLKGRGYQDSSKWLLEDADVKDRTLSDYVGNWQSVYPFLEDGTFDQVFDYKSKLTGKMTQAEYKAYYKKAIRQMSLRSTFLIILWNLFKVDKVRNSPTSMLVRKS